MQSQNQLLVKSKIEELVVKLLKQMVEGEHSLAVPRANRKTSNVQDVMFTTSIAKFCRVVKALSLIYNLLVHNKHATKRDLYYTHVRLFQTQSNLDEIIDDIACLFGVARHDLNIVRLISCATTLSNHFASYSVLHVKA